MKPGDSFAEYVLPKDSDLQADSNLAYHHFKEHKQTMKTKKKQVVRGPVVAGSQVYLDKDTKAMAVSDASSSGLKSMSAYLRYLIHKEHKAQLSALLNPGAQKTKLDK